MNRLLSVTSKLDHHTYTAASSFLLSSDFDSDWANIASNTVQAVGVSLSHTNIEASPIIPGLKEAIQEFSIVMIPDLGEENILDIPRGRAIRVCSNVWVITSQAPDSAMAGHCDKTLYDITELIVVPHKFDWSRDFYPPSEEDMDQSDSDKPGFSLCDQIYEHNNIKATMVLRRNVDGLIMWK